MNAAERHVVMLWAFLCLLSHIGAPHHTETGF